MLKHSFMSLNSSTREEDIRRRRAILNCKSDPVAVQSAPFDDKEIGVAESQFDENFKSEANKHQFITLNHRTTKPFTLSHAPTEVAKFLSRTTIEGASCQFEVLNNDLIDALNNLDKTANIVRRFFINDYTTDSLTSGRLKLADNVVNAMNAVITELIMERLDLNGNNYHPRMIASYSESGSISSAISRVSAASSMSSHILREVNKEKKSTISHNSIESFIKSHGCEEINKICFDSILRKIDYAAKALRSAVLYFAKSARCNDAKKEQYKEYIFQLGDIIIVLNFRSLELAKGIDSEFQHKSSSHADYVRGAIDEVAAHIPLSEELELEQTLQENIVSEEQDDPSKSWPKQRESQEQEEANNRKEIETSQTKGFCELKSDFYIEHSKLLIKEAEIKARLQEVEQSKSRLSTEEDEVRNSFYKLEAKSRSNIVDSLIRTQAFEEAFKKDRFKLKSTENIDRVEIMHDFYNKAFEISGLEEANGRKEIETNQTNDFCDMQTSFHTEKSKLIIREAEIKEAKVRLLKELEQKLHVLPNEESDDRKEIYRLEANSHSNIVDSLDMLKKFERNKERDRLELKSNEIDSRDKIIKQEEAVRDDLYRLTAKSRSNVADRLKLKSDEKGRRSDVDKQENSVRNELIGGFHRKKFDIEILEKTRDEAKSRAKVEETETMDRNPLLLAFNTEKNRIAVADVAKAKAEAAKKAEAQRLKDIEEAAKKVEAQRVAEKNMRAKAFGF